MKNIDLHYTIDANYRSLMEQFIDALIHASQTKGKERHANNLPFEKQKICRINRDVGIGYGLGQIIKKAEEVTKLPPDKGILELCGIINYAAGLMVVLKEQIKNKSNCNVDHKEISNKICLCINKEISEGNCDNKRR